VSRTSTLQGVLATRRLLCPKKEAVQSHAAIAAASAQAVNVHPSEAVALKLSEVPSVTVAVAARSAAAIESLAAVTASAKEESHALDANHERAVDASVGLAMKAAAAARNVIAVAGVEVAVAMRAASEAAIHRTRRVEMLRGGVRCILPALL
jgi:hypothetical protein